MEATTSAVAARSAPVFPGLPFIGSLYEVQKDPLGFFERVGRLGDLVEVVFPFRKSFSFGRPEHVKHIMVDHHRRFGKQTRGYRTLRMVLGQGLVTSEGELWKRQRRIAQPAFQHHKITHFGQIMTDETERMLKRWSTDNKLERDIDQEMMRLTLAIVGRSLMSTDLSDGSATFGAAVATLLRFVVYRTTHPLTLPLGFPTPRNREFAWAKAQLDRLVYSIIAERRKGGADGALDLLSMLMDAVDEETGERMSDLQLHDEVLTMILAGHETTANALNWTFHLLAQHPDIEAKLMAELGSVLGSRAPVTADLPQLPYLEAVIKESMRLYPPVWMIARSADEEDVIDGVRIPKGAMCFLSPWVFHRNPRLFDAPLSFRPERFLGAEAEAIPRHAYFPFAAGPRVCIGNGFAMMEARLILAGVLSRFHLESVPGHPVVPEPTVTLRPRYGLLMKTIPRARP